MKVSSYIGQSLTLGITVGRIEDGRLADPMSVQSVDSVHDNSSNQIPCSAANTRTGLGGTFEKLGLHLIS